MAEPTVEQMIGLELPIPLNTIFLIIAGIIGLWIIAKKKKEAIKKPYLYITLAIFLLAYAALQSAGFIPPLLPSSYIMFGASLLLLLSSIVTAIQERR